MKYMFKSGALLIVLILLITSVFALNSDFNNDGKVDFDPDLRNL